MPRQYCINVSSKGATNKGSFDVLFNPPLYFPPGSTMALKQMNIYNAIYNISASRGNNIFFIAGLNSNTIDGLNAFATEGTTTLYKITIPDGIYGVGDLDDFFAKLLGDWNTTTDQANDYGSRKFVIQPDNTTGKFKFELPNVNYDILWQVSNISSKRSMEFFVLTLLKHQQQ
jgi:hypothetical protein